MIYQVTYHVTLSVELAVISPTDQVLVQEVQVVRQVKEQVEQVQEVQAYDQSHLGLLLEVPLGGSGPV